MKTKSAWKKIPSVTRANKHFYFFACGRRHVSQNWNNDQWRLSENGKVSDVEFATPGQAMTWAESNVLH